MLLGNRSGEVYLPRVPETNSSCVLGNFIQRVMPFITGLPYNRTATSYRSLGALGMTIVKFLNKVREEGI